MLGKKFNVFKASYTICCRYTNALFAMLRYLLWQSTCGGEGAYAPDSLI
ncbi:MAG: hypothetical protein IPP48_10125 [Chitinophagaceae bacterium]|nr:hypothetical protein [Chitinophagaceae bacterium]